MTPPGRQNYRTVRLKIFISIVLIFFPFFSQSQSFTKKFKSLSAPEKWWVLTHLSVAKKALIISEQARIVSKEMEKDSLLDHDADGGQVDAFRHAYWMAKLAQQMCWHKALKLGIAHEKGDYKRFKKHMYEENSFADSAASAMDLYNNKVGLETGCKNKLSDGELIILLRQKIINGEMKVIFKNSQRASVDCNGNIIDANLFRNKWDTPRCIVPSNRRAY
jgi:hypothetical protein